MGAVEKEGHKLRTPNEPEWGRKKHRRLYLMKVEAAAGKRAWFARVPLRGAVRLKGGNVLGKVLRPRTKGGRIDERQTKKERELLALEQIRQKRGLPTPTQRKAS